VKLLLDTHIFIWFLAGDTRLSPSDRALIEAPTQQCFVSIVTAWEIAIKIDIIPIKKSLAFGRGNALCLPPFWAGTSPAPTKIIKSV